MSVKVYMTLLSKKNLQRQPIKFKKGVVKGSKFSIELLEIEAKKGFSNTGLHVRSGDLRRSITGQMKVQGDKVIGVLGSDSIYAAIHEFGGVIATSGKQYLTFQGKYGWAKVSQVIIPKRPFLRPAVERNRRSMRQEIIRGINKEMR